MARNALGRGLGALIREPEPQVPEVARCPSSAYAQPTPALAGSQLVDIDLIEPSPYQPRTHFAKKLWPSWRIHSGQRNHSAAGAARVGSRFQLLAGERRWRAAQRAGLGRVPAVIREVRTRPRWKSPSSRTSSART